MTRIFTGSWTAAFLGLRLRRTLRALENTQGNLARQQAVEAACSTLQAGTTAGTDAAAMTRAQQLVSENEQLWRDIERTRAELAALPPRSILALLAGTAIYLVGGLALLLGLLTDAGDSLSFEWLGLGAAGGALLVPPARWYAALLRVGAAFVGSVSLALLGEALTRVTRNAQWNNEPLTFNGSAVAIGIAVLAAILVGVAWKAGLGVSKVGIIYAAVVALTVMLQSDHLLQKAQAERIERRRVDAQQLAERRAREAAELKHATDNLGAWVTRADAALKTADWQSVRAMVQVMERAAPNSDEVARVRGALDRREAQYERQQQAERARQRAGPCIENCEARCRDQIQGCLLRNPVEVCREAAQAVNVCIGMCPSVCEGE